MTTLLHELLIASAARRPDVRALKHRRSETSYQEICGLVAAFGRGLIGTGLERQERVAVYLPKRIETVTAILGTAMAGGVFVPKYQNISISFSTKSGIRYPWENMKPVNSYHILPLRERYLLLRRIRHQTHFCFFAGSIVLD